MSSTLQPINHLCVFCKKPDQPVKACGYCHNFFYCSRNCQQLDWKTHKTFCQKEDKSLAVARRQKCLEIIESCSNAIFRYLFTFNYMGMNGFLFVSTKDNKARYVPLSTHEILNEAAALNLSGREYNALIHAAVQTQFIETKVLDQDRSNAASQSKMVSKGIPVLFEAGERSYSVYVLGSSAMIELAKSIQNMPNELSTGIMNDYLRESINTMNPSTLGEILSVISGPPSTPDCPKDE